MIASSDTEAAQGTVSRADLCILQINVHSGLMEEQLRLVWSHVPVELYDACCVFNDKYSDRGKTAGNVCSCKLHVFRFVCLIYTELTVV